MEKIRFGKTELTVSRTGFGAIPIQRISEKDAVALLHHAFDEGINLYDTARAYTDSEVKLGIAFSDIRKDVILCTKTLAKNRDGMFRDLETSLKNLKTDYVDLYQLHNPKSVPMPGDEMYDTLVEMKNQGMIKHFGITNHSTKVAKQAIESNLYESLQFPLSPISMPEEFELVELCKSHDMGFLAMKALAGGILTKAVSSFIILRQYENVVPIWGQQFMHELDEILEYEKNPPAMTDEIQASIDKDKEELGGTFCRGCGYCMPCPAEIPIDFAAKMSHSLFRVKSENFLNEEWLDKMNRIDNCVQCNHCIDNCPYGIDTPALLRAEQAKYNKFYERHQKGLPLKED